MSRNPQTPPEGSRQFEPPRNLDEAVSALLAEREARERAEARVSDDPPRTKVQCPECGRRLGDVVDSLVRQRGRFKSQREQQRKRAELAEADRDAAVARAEQAEAERDELRKALAFYADPETYFAIAFVGDPPCGPFLEDFEDMPDFGAPKPGNRARAALSSLRDGNDEGTSMTAEAARSVGRESRNSGRCSG